MDPKEKQKLMVLFGIFAVAGVIMYYNLLLRPQFSKFIVMNRDFQTVKSRIRSAEALIANESRIGKQHDNLAGEVEALEERLPGQDEVSGLLEDFSRVAESSGVKILKIKPLEPLDEIGQSGSGSAFYSDFPILIEARAGYHQCGIFINRLEDMGRFIKIEDIDIKGTAGDPRRHHIRLRVNTYIVK